MLRAHSLFDIVDGSNKCPPEYLCDSDGKALVEVNPAYLQWFAQDRALITLINATLSKVAFSFVINCKSSREVWLALEKRFSSLTRSHIHELKSALHTVSKSPIESVDDYLIRIKEIVDKLATVAVKIDDEDVLLYTLNGLPVEYNSFRTSIRTRRESVSLDELHALLCSLKVEAINPIFVVVVADQIRDKAVVSIIKVVVLSSTSHKDSQVAQTKI